ncbi:MAG: N-acetyltransferase [Bacilli bacterium]
MEILLATSKNINRILKIYESAKKFMESEHNHQWHAGYPGFKMVKAEIKKKELYVIKDKDVIVGVFAFIIGVDHTYLKIDGAWLNDEPYGTIHRLAKIGEAKGILEAALNFCLTKVDNIRIDTKDTNISMNNKLLSIGFKRTGIIKIDNGEDRIAYQFVKEGKK